MPRIEIADVSDPRLAPYRSLHERNLTRLSGQFIAEGDKVTERLLRSRFSVVSLLAEPEPADRFARLVPPDVPVFVAPRKVLEETVGFNFHRGVLGCARRLPRLPVAEALSGGGSPASTVLVCPDVQDPTNLGTIIRSAAAFGCEAMILGGRCADPLSRRVLRVSMGAALFLPIVESTDLAADLNWLRASGYELLATVLDPAAEPLHRATRRGKLALLLGSEGHGLDAQWLAACDRQITVPMQLGIDSLNVAAAAAVFLYHFSVAAAVPDDAARAPVSPERSA